MSLRPTASKENPGPGAGVFRYEGGEPALTGRGSAEGIGRAERRATGTSYLSLIDGVRGVAALGVLFYHYVHFFMAGPSRSKLPHYLELYPARAVFWPLYEYGFYAVQVFWIISGFVFTHVYYRHPASTRSFFVNRLARLYPLHLLTLIVVTGLQLVALNRLGYTPIYGNFDWQDFGLQLFMAGDWIRRGMSFNGPVWSVSVEIVIYALFWFGRGAIARLGLPLLAALVFSLLFADGKWGLHSRVFDCGYYFFLGFALCVLWRSKWAQGWSVAAFAVLLGGGGVWATARWGIWGWNLMGLPGVFGGLFLLLATAEARAPRLLRQGCEWLGENTYGVYLWHFPIQLTMFVLLMPAIAPQTIAQHGWFLALYLALVVIVARVSYVHFERPMRDVLRRRLGGGSVRAKGGDKPGAVR